LGAVVNPSDIKKRGRKIVEELARDLDPASREAVTRVYENWKGEESEEELRRILGERLAKKFLRAVR
jgi:predicted phosphoribosyltransferase